MPRRPRAHGRGQHHPRFVQRRRRLSRSPERAIEHALRLVGRGRRPARPRRRVDPPGGAGATAPARARSTRSEELAPPAPGARRLAPRERRLPISIDTRKARGGPGGPRRRRGSAQRRLRPRRSGTSRRLAARAGCPVVLMHHRGIFSGSRGRRPRRSRNRAESLLRVVGEVRSGLAAALARALAAGCRQEQIVLDPGLGFGKRGEAESGAPAPAERARRARLPAARRREPQELPR